MVTGGVGFGYGSATQPLTQTNVPGYPVTASTIIPAQFVGGLDVAAPNVSKVATGYTGRRQIVETARCNKCHAALGVFTASAFHVGQRNDANTCAWCHNPNRVSSGGWSLDSGVFIHAIHAADKRTVPFGYNASAAEPLGMASIGYPGVLQKCETCHLPGTYDFSASASASALSNRLYRTAATGIYNGTAGTVTTGTVTTSNPTGTMQTTFGVTALSPYVKADNATNYGAGFTTTTAAAGTTLVSSPIAAVMLLLPRRQDGLRSYAECR